MDFAKAHIIHAQRERETLDAPPGDTKPHRERVERWLSAFAGREWLVVHTRFLRPGHRRDWKAATAASSVSSIQSQLTRKTRPFVHRTSTRRAEHPAFPIWHAVILAPLLVFGSEIAAKADSSLSTLQSDPKQWVMQNKNYSSIRFSILDQVNTSNAHRLKVSWSQSTGVLRGHAGGPLIVDGVLYLVTPFPNVVQAFDLDNPGRRLWIHEPKIDPNTIPIMCCDTINRGLAYANGTLFLYRNDAKLVALDAKTGKEIWSVQNGDSAKGETATSAPFVLKEKVIVGISGGEFGVRGHLTAYDRFTGKQIWRYYSTGPDHEIGIRPSVTTHLGKPIEADTSLSSWNGEQWKIGGGTPWGWISYDPELNLIYHGTGNPGTWNPVQRPGDNKWAASIFARDADSGLVRWVFQTTPHDQWEFGAVNELILIDVEVEGIRRKTLIQFNKNGFAYIIDRASGVLISAPKFLHNVNWATEVDVATGRPKIVLRYSLEHNGEDVQTRGICPSSLGAKNIAPAAYSPVTGLFYIPSINICSDHEPFRVKYTAGEPFVGAQISMYPGLPFPRSSSGRRDNMGALIAWDPRTQQTKWVNEEIFPVYSGTVVTKGGVVIYGTLDGMLKVADANTGRVLSSERLPSGIIGNVVTYEHRGKQYIAVLAGIGGWPGIGLAVGITDPPEAGLGVVGGLASLREYVSLGGALVVLELGPDPLAAVNSAASAAAERPLLALSAVAVMIWLVGWYLLYRAAPLHFSEIARYLERTAKIPLPGEAAREIKIPAHWLILGWLWRRPRVLDAWTRQHVPTARARFGAKATVSDRSTHVPVPVYLDGRHIAAISGHDLRPVFERSGTDCLLIWGEGGSGKTSLACQIGRWLMAETSELRPIGHLAVPILIERELDFDDPRTGDVFTETIRTDLSRLVDGDVEEDLFLALLSGRWIVVIIDHYSEMSPETRELTRPDAPGRPRMAAIFTSRIREELWKVARSECELQRITGDFLSEFMTTYLREKNARHMFGDAEFFTACSRLAELAGTRSITAGLVSMYADQLIASKTEKTPAALPRNIPELILSYVNKLNDSISRDGRMPPHKLFELGKRISWLCIRSRFRMSPATFKGRNSRIICESGSEEEARHVVEYLVTRVQLCEYNDMSHEWFVVKLDPVGEYLAALHVVETNGSGEAAWRDFLREADAKEGAPERIRGFLYAVRDCCLAHNRAIHTRRDGKVPVTVISEIETRLSLDPAEERDRQLRAEIQRLIASLSPAREIEERRSAIKGLKNLEMRSKDVAAAFLDALKDNDPLVQLTAIKGMDLLEEFGSYFLPQLMDLVDKSEDANVVAAARVAIEKMR